MSTAEMRGVILSAPDGVGAVEDVLRALVTPSVKLRDGDRYAAFDQPLTLSLAGPGELPEGAAASLTVKVDDVAAAFATLLSAGASPAQEPTRGGHELKAAVWLTSGVALTVYSPL